MTSSSRPSLARKHTRKSEEARKNELDTGVKITIDDDEFIVRIGDVTPALAKELRQNTGMSFMKLMQAAGEDPDVDVLTSLEWLARRIRGEDVEFEDVEFSYADLFSDGFSIDEAEAEVVDDNPEI